MANYCRAVIKSLRGTPKKSAGLQLRNEAKNWRNRNPRFYWGNPKFEKIKLKVVSNRNIFENQNKLLPVPGLVLLVQLCQRASTLKLVKNRPVPKLYPV